MLKKCVIALVLVVWFFGGLYYASGYEPSHEADVPLTQGAGL